MRATLGGGLALGVGVAVRGLHPPVEVLRGGGMARPGDGAA